jgi:hypothetical protein
LKVIKIYIGLFILIIVLKTVYDFNQPRPIDWTSSFFSNHKIPYGTYILHNELAHFFPKSQIESINITAFEYLSEDYKINKGTYSRKMNYFFLNDFVSLDKKSSEELLYFVNQGNNVFIASHTIPRVIKDSLHLKLDSYFVGENEDVNLNFANTYLDHKKYNYDIGLKNYFFKKLDKQNTTVLGYSTVSNNKKINFVDVKYGNGHFYLNTQPYAFTNYHMLKSNHAVYVASCLSYLPDYKMLWDDRVKSRTEEVRTPLRFILSKPSLKYAWLLALFSVFIFMIFRAKRRQRIVPIIKKLPNTSIAFAKTIGNLYYQEGKPKDIITKKTTYFLEHIRNTYLIDTQNLNDEFKKRLQQKTGIQKDEIERLVNFIVNLNNDSEPKEHSLVTLNKLIDKFYQKTKL